MPLTSLDYMQQGHDSKHKQHGQLLVMVSSHLKHSDERRSGATSGSTRGVPGVGGGGGGGGQKMRESGRGSLRQHIRSRIHLSGRGETKEKW